MGRKSAKIAGKKDAADKARSQMYTKFLRDVTTAAKDGGGDPDTNFILKVALDRCRKANVPKDNIDRAIKKGLGGDFANYNEITYEGYGADGVAIFVEALTDNPTRTIANVRSKFKRWEGSVGKEGCLQFIFERKSIFTLKDTGIDPDELLMELIDEGAEEIEKEDDLLIVSAPVESYGTLLKKLDAMDVELEDSGLERVPLIEKEISNENYEKISNLINSLEEDDDVQTVYHNVQWRDEFNEL